MLIRINTTIIYFYKNTDYNYYYYSITLNINKIKCFKNSNIKLDIQKKSKYNESLNKSRVEKKSHFSKSKVNRNKFVNHRKMTNFGGDVKSTLNLTKIKFPALMRQRSFTNIVKETLSEKSFESTPTSYLNPNNMSKIKRNT